MDEAYLAGDLVSGEVLSLESLQDLFKSILRRPAVIPFLGDGRIGLSTDLRAVDATGDCTSWRCSVPLEARSVWGCLGGPTEGVS